MVYLTKEEERMLEGECGVATQEAMKTLVTLADVYDAKRMVDAVSAHVAGGLFPEEAEWYDNLVEGEAKFRCFTTRHPWGIDYEHWEDVGTLGGSAPFIKEHLENMLGYTLKMGVIPLGTCIQYLLGDLLRRGDHFSWTGSGGVVFANSVLGAYGNVDGIVTNYAVAITGKVPEYGLHLPENRYGHVLIDCNKLNFKEFTDADYGALAFYVGEEAGDRIPVFKDLPKNISLEQLRAIASPLHVSGAVPMFHAIGVTPEAPSLDAAFGGEKPEEKIVVKPEDIKKTYERISTTSEEKVDLVNFGCPHCTYNEIREIAEMLKGRKVNKDVKLWVGTSYQVKVIADRAGWTQMIENAGGLVVTNICMGPGAPFAGVGAKMVATNSPRSAYYAPNVEHLYGSMKDCVEAAITGKWVR